jgi:hypothetical protein
MARRKAARTEPPVTAPAPTTLATPEITPTQPAPDATDFPFGALAGRDETQPAQVAPPAAANEPRSADAAKPGPHPYIRSWTRDFVLGYQILTDDRLRVIVLRFDDRPADEVLEMVKAKGFKYRELREHGRAWVTDNDWEGRTLTDQLDQELYRYRTGQTRPEQGVA